VLDPFITNHFPIAIKGATEELKGYERLFWEWRTDYDRHCRFI